MPMAACEAAFRDCCSYFSIQIGWLGFRYELIRKKSRWHMTLRYIITTELPFNISTVSFVFRSRCVTISMIYHACLELNSYFIALQIVMLTWFKVLFGKYGVVYLDWVQQRIQNWLKNRINWNSLRPVYTGWLKSTVRTQWNRLTVNEGHISGLTSG